MFFFLYAWDIGWILDWKSGLYLGGDKWILVNALIAHVINVNVMKSK